MDVGDTPIVVVLGSTGAGKSKLAIEIAEEFNGEIISADSMQVYKGLDIISNKVTPEEQEQVPHHMIDVVEPTTNYSVVKFRDACLAIIKDLRGRHKLPVIVGGTNYYIEAVLWKILVADRTLNESDGETDTTADSSVSRVDTKSTDTPAEGAGRPAERGASDRQQLQQLSTEELYAQLRELDPAQAQILHPNERRKTLRSLEVVLRSGRPMSEHLRLQRAEAGGGALGGPLRFPRTCLLWVTADQETLDRRLDGRVDTMLQRGLLAELADFHRRYNAARLGDGSPADYTRGIFQSIGFKEFHSYLTRPEAADADEADRLLAEGVDRLKLVTRRYARKQTRWVRRRFLSSGSRQVPPLYRLDSTDPGRWEELVRRPAADVVRAWLDGRTPALEPERLSSVTAGDKTTHYCPVCDVYTSGTEQRDAHLRSRRHHRALQGQKRRQHEEERADAKRRALEGDRKLGALGDRERREEGGEVAGRQGTDGEVSERTDGMLEGNKGDDTSEKTLLTKKGDEAEHRAEGTA